MTDSDSTVPQSAANPPRWQPIGAIDRRVLGVLAEKAKTTPAGYPMSLNAVCSGCNQKSNRAPLMDLQPEDVEESLERLRLLGAVGMIEGHGRVAKYRHYLYEWLGVDKLELAVMAELLLRGAQTEGELRARASRMDPIADLGGLRPVVASLKTKGLVTPLNPEGRGHVVTHSLYSPREMENLKAQYGQVALPTSAEGSAPSDRDRSSSGASATTSHSDASSADAEAVDLLRQEIAELRGQLDALQHDLDALSSRQEQTDEELHRLRTTLGA